MTAAEDPEANIVVQSQIHPRPGHTRETHNVASSSGRAPELEKAIMDNCCCRRVFTQ